MLKINIYRFVLKISNLLILHTCLSCILLFRKAKAHSNWINNGGRSKDRGRQGGRSTDEGPNAQGMNLN